MAARTLGHTTKATMAALAILVLIVGIAPRVQSTAQNLPLAGDSLTYFVAIGDSRSGYRSSDRELAEWALQAWARSAPQSLTLRASSEREALIRVYWAPPDDDTFGEMRTIVVDGRARAAVFVRADMEALGPELARQAGQDILWRDTIVYLTCVHEIGHALGLAHTTDYRDIMYFFGYGGDIVEYFARYRRQLAARRDILSVSALSGADVARLRVLHRAP